MDRKWSISLEVVHNINDECRLILHFFFDISCAFLGSDSFAVLVVSTQGRVIYVFAVRQVCFSVCEQMFIQ